MPWTQLCTYQAVERTKGRQSKTLSLQLPGFLGCFEWKAFYALLKHGWHGFHVLVGAEGRTMARCVNSAWKTLLPNRMRSLLLKSAWSLVLLPWTLSLSLPPKLNFQGKAAGRIIPPDLSPWSVKALNMDGGRLGERKKVASVRLWGFIFPTHAACAWGNTENNEHGSLVLRGFCFCKQKLEGKTNPC